MTKTYPKTWTLEMILDDGWAMGFTAKETIDAATEAGYTVTKEKVYQVWNQNEAEYQEFLENE